MKVLTAAIVLMLSAWADGLTMILPADVIVIEGNDAEFTCSPLNMATLPVLQIRPDSGSAFQNVEASDPRLSLVDSGNGRTYTYSNLQRDEDGTQFTCSVNGISAPTPVTITVNFPPTFTNLGVQTVVEGMDIEVTFTVEARPAATAVSLTRSGGAAVAGDTTYDADSVSFVDVQRADAGEYTLTSSNVAGEGSGTFILDVQYAPEFAMGSGTMNRAVMVGGSITFSCVATGNPDPTVTFSTTPSPDPHGATESDGVLTIANATDVPGPVTYQCMATNDVDSIDTLSYTLYTGELPTVSNLVVMVTDTTVTITWSFTDGGIPRQFLTFVLRFVSTTSDTETINQNAPDTGMTISITVESRGEVLEANTNYTLTVSASNLLGDGSQAGEQMFMTVTSATCDPNPCENGGTCNDGVNSFTCDCVAGYTGELCETGIDECVPNPCQNRGTCTDGVNSFTCDCVDGFTGTNCDVADEEATEPGNVTNGGLRTGAAVRITFLLSFITAGLLVLHSATPGT